MWKGREEVTRKKWEKKRENMKEEKGNMDSKKRMGAGLGRPEVSKQGDLKKGMWSKERERGCSEERLGGGEWLHPSSGWGEERASFLLVFLQKGYLLS